MGNAALWFLWPRRLGAGVAGARSVLWRGLVVGASLKARRWAVWPSLGVGVGAGGDKARFLSDQCVWVLDGSGVVDTALWTFMFWCMSMGSMRPGLFLGWVWL